MSHKYPPIQIVDENDKPIGSMRRADAYEKGKIHRIIRLILENPKGEILLQKRSSTVNFPNLWDCSVAGHVDGGEDYKTAAYRELKEELGIDDLPIKFVGTYYAEVPFEDLRLKRFNSVYKGVIDFIPQGYSEEEIAELRWFNIDELKDMINNQPDKSCHGIVEVIERFY